MTRRAMARLTDGGLAQLRQFDAEIRAVRGPVAYLSIRLRRIIYRASDSSRLEWFTHWPLRTFLHFCQEVPVWPVMTRSEHEPTVGALEELGDDLAGWGDVL